MIQDNNGWVHIVNYQMYSLINDCKIILQYYSDLILNKAP